MTEEERVPSVDADEMNEVSVSKQVDVQELNGSNNSQDPEGDHSSTTQDADSHSKDTSIEQDDKVASQVTEVPTETAENAQEEEIKKSEGSDALIPRDDKNAMPVEDSVDIGIEQQAQNEASTSQVDNHTAKKEEDQEIVKTEEGENDEHTNEISGPGSMPQNSDTIKHENNTMKSENDVITSEQDSKHEDLKAKDDSKPDDGIPKSENGDVVKEETSETTQASNVHGSLETSDIKEEATKEEGAKEEGTKEEGAKEEGTKEEAAEEEATKEEATKEEDNKEEVQKFSDDEIDVEGVSSDSEPESESSFSESDNNSDSDYADSGVEEDDDDQINPQELDEEEAELNNGGPITSTNETSEVAPQLPKDYKIDEKTPIEHAGQIIGLVDQSVIIKANTSGEFRVLKEESVFCFKDRTVIGPLCETFGRLQQPIYRVKFNTEEEFEPFKDKNGEEVYYVVPDSQFLYTDTIKQLKGTDASNCHDEELPEDEQEHSDDELEMNAKQAKKKKKQKANKTQDQNASSNKRNVQPLDPAKRFQPYNYALPMPYQLPQQPYQAYPPPSAQHVAYAQSPQTGQPVPYQQPAYRQPPMGAYGQSAPAAYQQPACPPYQAPGQQYAPVYPQPQAYQPPNEFIGGVNSPYGVPYNQTQHAYYQNNGQGYVPPPNAYQHAGYPMQTQFQPPPQGDPATGYQLQQQLQQLQQLILQQVNPQNEAQQKNNQPGAPGPNWRG